MLRQKHSLMQRILDQLPPETRYSFSENQVEALHRSALSLPKAKHAISVRWSIPLPGKGVYMVFFAGQENRSRKRLMADGDFQVLPRLVLILASLVGCATIFGLAYGQRRLAISKQRSAASLHENIEVHPTVVPFKYDQEQCETSLREWKDGKCVDYEHDHTF